MINIRQFITEKLKVSSANVPKIDFNMFAEALYEYSKDRNRKFDLEYLDYYKDLPIEESINALGVTLEGFDIYSAPYVESL